LNGRYYELEYKKYAILTLQIGHDARHRVTQSNTKLISMCTTFMSTRRCDLVEVRKQREKIINRPAGFERASSWWII
jgi:hypothetical protein